MKKYTFMIFLVFVMLKIQAQDYLISFAATGATSEIDKRSHCYFERGRYFAFNPGSAHRLP